MQRHFRPLAGQRLERRLGYRRAVMGKRSHSNPVSGRLHQPVTVGTRGFVHLLLRVAARSSPMPCFEFQESTREEQTRGDQLSGFITNARRVTSTGE